jgi:hypothetical protein
MSNPRMMFCHSSPKRLEGIRGRGLEVFARGTRWFRYNPGSEEEYNIAILELV